MYSRRRFTFLAGAAVAATGWSLPALPSENHDLAVWKDPWCGCCGGWIAHMQAAGHSAEVTELEDMEALKTELGIPVELRSCHTAKVGGYLIEGHVPAQAVEKLMRERPDVIGLAVLLVHPEWAHRRERLLTPMKSSPSDARDRPHSCASAAPKLSRSKRPRHEPRPSTFGCSPPYMAWPPTVSPKAGNTIQTAMAIIIRFSVNETKPSGTLLEPPTQAHLSSRLSM
jgi:Predicted metal-binding protein